MKVRWVALLAIEDKLIEKLSVCVSRQRFGRIENLLESLGALFFFMSTTTVESKWFCGSRV